MADRTKPQQERNKPNLSLSIEETILHEWENNVAEKYKKDEDCYSKEIKNFCLQFNEDEKLRKKYFKKFENFKFERGILREIRSVSMKESVSRKFKDFCLDAKKNMNKKIAFSRVIFFYMVEENKRIKRIKDKNEK